MIAFAFLVCELSVYDKIVVLPQTGRAQLFICRDSIAKLSTLVRSRDPMNDSHFDLPQVEKSDFDLILPHDRDKTLRAGCLFNLSQFHSQ